MNFKQMLLSLSLGQKIASILILLMVIAAGYAVIQTVLKPAVIVQQDYDPFGSKQEYDAFYKAHPVMFKKAPETALFHFKSSVSPNKQVIYQIYLFEPSVKAGDIGATKEYEQLLKTYQQQAKDWFKQQGEDLSKAYVLWYPNPDLFDPTPTPTGKPKVIHGTTPTPVTPDDSTTKFPE